MTAEVQSLSRSWSSPIAADATLFLALAIYARGWNRLRAVLADRFPFWRLAAFSAGVVSVWIAIGSPLAALDDASLTVHMAQHLLLTTIAPPLILLSAPELPLLRGLPQSPARAIVIPFLRLHWVKRFGRLISNPAVCWLAATLTLLAWHFPAVFELALRLDWLHKL
jgi:putative membrane protein